MQAVDPCQLLDELAYKMIQISLVTTDGDLEDALEHAMDHLVGIVPRAAKIKPITLH